ncbi:hypothetical protein [Roseovarius sp. EL26]|uniref:hypothetical protein n=1 Tax=Roseovarius sp. EL26 TaxID=2126672 RepID=UPI000EA00B87|nr:hypothetical protein [Roseovarius sp. EL26]
MIEFLFALVVLVFVLWLYIFLPWGMAITRGRSAIVWVLISLAGTPLFAIPLLLALGNVED